MYLGPCRETWNQQHRAQKAESRDVLWPAPISSCSTWRGCWWHHRAQSICNRVQGWNPPTGFRFTAPTKLPTRQQHCCPSFSEHSAFCCCPLCSHNVSNIAAPSSSAQDYVKKRGSWSSKKAQTDCHVQPGQRGCLLCLTPCRTDFPCGPHSQQCLE